MGGLELEDIRLSRDEFEAQRDAGGLPFGQLPVMDLPGGERVATAGAILRLVGKWGGLYPADPLEACHVDMLMDLEGDLMLPMLLTVYPTRLGLPAFPSEEDVAARRLELLSKGGPVERRLSQLEAALVRFGFGRSDGDPWAAGTQHPTIADCALVPRLAYLTSGELHGLPQNVLEPYPQVSALVDRFRQHPIVQAVGV